MRFRKLRIAWSVCWAITCALLIGLWLKSYWSTDRIYLRPSAVREVAIWHARGQVILWMNDLRLQASHYPDGSTRINSWPIEDYPVLQLKFDYSVLDYGWSYGIPYWFPTFLFAIAAAVAWTPWPKEWKRLNYLIVVLAILVIIFVTIGLLVTIDHDLSTRWPAM
jgi:hypothetical protein